MLDPAAYGEVLVLVAHPFGDQEVPLPVWIGTGPGPRPFVAIQSARHAVTREPIPLSEIPLEYHNSLESRRRQREGTLPCPWGPPPDEDPGCAGGNRART